MNIVDEALKRSGVKTSEAMRSHAFRKGFMSICEQKGMKSINVKMLLGHDIGVSGHYYRPAESDILEDYMTYAADALTVDPAHRLKKRVDELETEKGHQLAVMQRQIDQIEQSRSEMLRLKEQFNEMKQKIDRIDLVDLQTFPSDYTIHNLLADHGIDYKEQKQNKADSKSSTNNSK